MQLSASESLLLIERAKQEWEATVDSLPQFIGLLDEQGYIVRANRTVEWWQLASVIGTKGRSIHDLFHPHCDHESCYLRAFWMKAWLNLKRGYPSECEAEDWILRRYLHFQVRPISTQTTTGIASESFAVVVAQDITKRKEMETALESVHEALTQQVEAQTASLVQTNSMLRQEINERKQAEIEKTRLLDEVEHSRSQLRRLAQKIVSAHEEERQRLSHELHDETGQILTTLKIMLALTREELSPDDSLYGRLDEAVALTDMAMERLRSVARDLRPAALDAAGLDPTLEGLCRDFARWTQIVIDYRGLSVDDLSESVKICLYCFLQEALTNVAKHAQANRVEVELRRDPQAVQLWVKDNGRGFQPPITPTTSDRSDGIGLLGMRERLELLNGRLEISSSVEDGVCLIAHVPLSGGV